MIQKLDIEVNDLYNAEEDFANVFLMDQVKYESDSGEVRQGINIRKSQDMERYPELQERSKERFNKDHSLYLDTKVPTILQEDTIEELVEDA